MNLESSLKQSAGENVDTSTVLSQSMNVLYGQQNDLDELADLSLPDSVPDSESRSGSQSLNVERMNDAQSRDADTNGMPQWAKGMCKQLDCIQKQLTSQIETQNRRWASVENQLQDQNTRMTNIESQVSQIGSLKQKVVDIDRELVLTRDDQKNMKRLVDEHEKGLQYHTQVNDDLTDKNNELSQKIDELTEKYDYLLKQQAAINMKQANTDEKMTDVRWRLMRENLIFTGFAESAVDPNHEDCETKVKDFIRDELHIDKDILFDRVHRLGRYSPTARYPRGIIASFTFYSDKELVRRAAPEKLMGSRFRVKEHFPQEIEEKRKLLYGPAKAARQNTNNKVTLVRDKLYVNGKQFIPGWSDQEIQPPNYSGSAATPMQNRPSNSEPQMQFGQFEQRQRQTGTRPKTQFQQQGSVGRGAGRGRGAWQRNRASSSGSFRGRDGNRNGRYDFSFDRGDNRNGQNDFSFGSNIPTFNRYSGLRNEELIWPSNEENGRPWDRQTTGAEKRKPTSPVDTDISTKRQTEYTNGTDTRRIPMNLDQTRD